MEEKITIEKLAAMTQTEFQRLEKNMVTRDIFQESFDVLLSEIRGLRGDVSNFRGAIRIEYSELLGRIEILEKDVNRLKHSR